MRKRPETEASTPNICFVSEMAYTVFRQNIKQLQMRCVNLLGILDTETSQERSTPKRLEEAISEVSE